MSIRIEKLAPVTLTGQAVAGGSLLPNTTYYLTAIFQRTNGFREGQPVANMCDEISVLTTTTDLSIQLNYSHSVNIVKFEDYSGGTEVKVTTDGLHSLLGLDNITISGTTNYNGTHVVRYDVADVDGTDAPNEFRILTTWVSDDATGVVTDDTDDVIGSNSYWSIRCATTQAYVAGEWVWSTIDDTDWIGPGYSAIAAVQGYTLTTKPTLTGANVVDYMPYFRRTASPLGVTELDRPYFYVSGDETWDSIVAAMELWLPNNTNYYKEAAVIGQTETLYFRASMAIGTMTTVMTASWASITLDGSLQASNYEHVQDYLIFNYCNFKQFGCRRPFTAGKFYRGHYRDECGDSPLYYYASLVDTSILPSGNVTYYGTTSAVWDGGTLILPTGARYLWYVYPSVTYVPQTRIKNLDILTGYLYVYVPNGDSSVAAGTHYLENVKIYSTEATRDFYTYQPTVSRVMECLDVTAPLQTDGIVRCRRSHVDYGEFRFFFSLSFHVVDSDGVNIVGATVSLTDKDLNLVTDDTDANGEVTLIVESYRNEVGLTVLGDYVDYNPFLLTIEQTGYQTYTEDNKDIYDKVDQVIALQDVVPALPETTIANSTIYNSTIY